MTSNHYSELLGRYMFDVVAMSVLIFVLYYPRYRHKETAIAAALLNIFIFAVLVVLSTMEFSLTAGFGLFAILAMFTLRSEPIGKSDMAYFFGSISIAVISAINGTSLMFITLLTLSVLLGVYIIDHPKMLKSVSQMTVKIDSIPQRFMEEPQAFKELLSTKLGVEILSYRVLDVCYVTEVIRAEVDFKARQ
jgi:hypothetical protein